MSRRRFRMLTVTASLAFLVAVASCSAHHATAPAVDSGPAANSPENAVRRLAWAWVHRDPAVDASVLTQDFGFAFAAWDSAGNAFPGRQWALADESRSMLHLFQGGSPRPPAAAISLTIDNLLLALADPRPGHASRWHRTVRTGVDMKVTVTGPDGTPAVYPVTGYALFYLVRGDSAVLSRAQAPGGGRDSTVWYVDRWEDQTLGSGTTAFHADPTEQRPLGSLKALYW